MKAVESYILEQLYICLCEVDVTNDRYEVIQNNGVEFHFPPIGKWSELLEDLRMHNLYAPDGHQYKEIFTNLANKHEMQQAFLRFRYEDQQYHWTNITMFPYANDHYIFSLKILEDQEIDINKQRAIEISDLNAIIVDMDLEKGSCYISPEGRQFTFYQNLEEEMGNSLWRKEDVHPQDLSMLYRYHSNLLENSRNSASIHIRLRTSNQAYMWCWLSTILTKNNENEIVRSYTLIHPDNNSNDGVRTQVYLPEDSIYSNKNYLYAFEKNVRELLKHRGNKKYAITYMDIKDFKMINQRFGMQFGNQVLTHFTNLVARTPEKGFYERISADIFVVCREYETQAQLLERIDNMQDKLNEFAHSLGKHLQIQMVSGIYAIEKETDVLDVLEMIDCANLAQKHAKYDIGYGAYVYNEELKQARLDNLAMISDFDNAIEEKQLQIYFQEQIRIGDPFTLAGVETLIRWIHPKKGFLSPDRFIPLFEENRMIIKLDEYVFTTVCEYIQKHSSNFPVHFRIAINLSPISLFSDGFLAKLIRIKQRMKIPDHLIELEITETSIVEDKERLKELMKVMHEVGFLIAMDDFGSGYSSLNAFREFDIDILKLDREFFMGDCYERKNKVIIQSLIKMIQALGIEIIAEGIEDQATLQFLRESHCDIVQGYIFSKPEPAHTHVLSDSKKLNSLYLQYIQNAR